MNGLYHLGDLPAADVQRLATRALDLRDGAPPVNVNQKPREFRAYRWILPEEFDLDWLPHFKREVYRQVMRDFFKVEL